jgi:hypothetical protein
MHAPIGVRHPLQRFSAFFSRRAVLALLVSFFIVESRLYTVRRFGVQEPFMDSFSEIGDYKAAVEGNYAEILEYGCHDSGG